MYKVSEKAEHLRYHLIEWELLNQDDIDPKALLSGAKLADLKDLVSSFKKKDDIPFVSAKLADLELLQRLGKVTRWNVTRSGKSIHLRFTTPAPRDVTIDYTLEFTGD